ncbi:hypothetical protein FQN50_004802 [Emmonsiellopsis sp. PD_5]|nr:hypothetical protein FQN50_004802 [Emmonsiellopsis sp. PD_5]
MAPITFSDFTTALAFISIIGLIMIYDQLTIMKNRLDAFHTRLTTAIRQGEAAEAEARTAMDKYNTLRKKMAALEERLNTYHCTMLTEITGIIERQNMESIDQHRDRASSSRQLCEVPSGSSRKTTMDGGVSSLNKRRPVVHSRDSCLIPHRSASTGGVDMRAAGEQPPPQQQQQLVVRQKPSSGKNSVRSVIASMGGRSWRLKTKEKKEIVRRRMASFHL